MFKKSLKGYIRKAAVGVVLASAAAAVLPQLAFADTVKASADVSGKTKAGPVEQLSEEKQNTLGDNRLEWDEIDELIHNYNAVVVKNRNEWSSDKRKNENASQVRDYLIDKADEYDSLYEQYADTSALTAASYKTSADSMRLQAESSVADSQVIELQYELIEKQTAETARTAFLNYYAAQYEQEYDTANEAYLEKLYVSAMNKQKLGMTTETEVLTAKENAAAAKAALLSAGTSIRSNYSTLTVMCGWKYDSEDAVIGALPELSADYAASVNYEQDKAKARENNLTLRMDELKLKNAQTGSYTALVVEQNQNQLNDDIQSFGINFKAAYDSLVNAGTAYTNTVNDRTAAERKLLTADNNIKLGTISSIEYEGVKNTLKSAEYAEQKAYIAMLQAKAKYDAAVNGNV